MSSKIFAFLRLIDFRVCKFQEAPNRPKHILSNFHDCLNSVLMPTKTVTNRQNAFCFTLCCLYLRRIPNNFVFYVGQRTTSRVTSYGNKELDCMIVSEWFKLLLFARNIVYDGRYSYIRIVIRVRSSGQCGSRFTYFPTYSVYCRYTEAEGQGPVVWRVDKLSSGYIGPIHWINSLSGE